MKSGFDFIENKSTEIIQNTTTNLKNSVNSNFDTISNMTGSLFEKF